LEIWLVVLEFKVLLMLKVLNRSQVHF